MQPYSVDWDRQRPSKVTDQAEWNASWEADLQKFYGGIRNSPPPAKRNKLRDFYAGGYQSTAMYIHIQTKQTLHLQRDIRESGMKSLAAENLAEDWAELDPVMRHENILHAFYKACTTSVERLRRYCPDLTITSLSKDSGKLFIDLLETIIGDGPFSVSNKVINFPNEDVDYSLAFLCLKDVSNYSAMVQCNRAYYVSLVVWRILFAMYNIDQAYRLLRPPKQKDEISELQRARQSGCTRIVKSIKNGIRERKTIDLVDLCSSCEKDVSSLPPETKLKACSGCKKIGRTVWYCSKKCQADDWQNGLPKPHKAICGKPFPVGDEGDRQESMSIPPPRSLNVARFNIPAPDANFKRSPALLFQIQMLQKFPNADYIIFMPRVGTSIGTIPLPLGTGKSPLHIKYLVVAEKFSAEFLAFRERAFQRGDPDAVNEMFNMLRPYAEGSIIASQLEREYRTTVHVIGKDPYKFHVLYV